MTRCLAFFGAFNPPTLAHVELARRAMILSGRECVLFVPSKAAYITVNQGKDYAFTDEERLEMLCSVAKKTAPGCACATGSLSSPGSRAPTRRCVT
jgi:nicotinic acid mononucleotide adenylyltransferase